MHAVSERHRRSHGCEAYTYSDGASLVVLSAAMHALRVLEFGTALGYTACCLAHGSARGHVDTVEFDAAHVALARENIKNLGFQNRITVHEGEFVAVAQTFSADYDLAFFDGFAPTLPQFQCMERLLRPGGMLITTNLQLGGDAALWRQLLSDERRWMTSDMAEGGRTAVSIKTG
ncbi:hypothetical protein AX767_01220 [Variovorax sp. PAMC 28711]|nr:hypothetical protein AX767_01220 [Variovorax sp. PAMC 28711]